MSFIFLYLLQKNQIKDTFKAKLVNKIWEVTPDSSLNNLTGLKKFIHTRIL